MAKSAKVSPASPSASSLSAKPGLLWSPPAIARELQMDPKTVRARIRSAPVAGRINGRPAYRLRDVIRLVLQMQPVTGNEEGEEEAALARMSPGDRKLWLDGEHTRLKILRESGDLVSSSDVRRVFAAAVQDIAALLDTLPDYLEREAGIGSHGVSVVMRHCDEARLSLMRQLQDIEDEDPEGDCGAD